MVDLISKLQFMKYSGGFMFVSVGFLFWHWTTANKCNDVRGESLFLLGKLSLEETFQIDSVLDVWPFVCIEVTAQSRDGEEGGRTIRGTVMLQETGDVQSKVRRPGEVVWVCVHPAYDL